MWVIGILELIDEDVLEDILIFLEDVGEFAEDLDNFKDQVIEVEGIIFEEVILVGFINGSDHSLEGVVLRLSSEVGGLLEHIFGL